MGWFFKDTKEAVADTGDMYVYLPDLLSKKQAHLSNLHQAKDDIKIKERECNRLLKLIRTDLQRAEQNLTLNKKELITLRTQKVMAEGESNAERFKQSITELEEKSLQSYKITELYGAIVRNISDKTSDMKGLIEPLQKSINRMEVEVEECQSVLSNTTPKEVEYFKRVNRIERFEELIPIFDKRKEENDKIISIVKDLLKFSSDEDEIRTQLAIFKLSEDQEREFKRKYI